MHKIGTLVYRQPESGTFGRMRDFGIIIENSLRGLGHTIYTIYWIQTKFRDPWCSSQWIKDRCEIINEKK